MLRFLAVPLLVLALFTTACGDDETTVGAPNGTDPDPGPSTELTIKYTHATQGLATTYRITCDGETASITAGGTDDDVDVGVDVDGQAACDALATQAVRERLIDGPPSDQICTEIYGGDDTATITGTIDGTDVDTTVDRANGCGIDDWDVVLADILPSPIGVLE